MKQDGKAWRMTISLEINNYKRGDMATSELESHPTASPTSISDFVHTPCYCEENVYMLCKRLCKDDVSDLFVAFISNDHKQVPLWHQRASKRADGLTIWDYHVICIQRTGEGQDPFQVWDLDSTLPFPSPLSQYVTEAIQPSFQVYPEYQRFFRVVHGPLFIRNFASDRRHMKDSAGNWMHQPPAYEPIVAADGTVHNLDKYVKIGAAEATSFNDNLSQRVLSESFGVVVGEGQLKDLFSLIS